MLDKKAFLGVVRSAFSFLERDWGFEFKGVEGQLPEFWATYASQDDCRVVVSFEAGSRPWVSRLPIFRSQNPPGSEPTRFAGFDGPGGVQSSPADGCRSRSR